MKRLLILAAVCGLLTAIAFAFQTQNAQQTTPFPLAAPAGKDSNARATAPAGAVNQGPFDPATWKYGTAFNPPAGAKIWNPVKLKMMQGGKVTGGTLFNSTDPAVYCAIGKPPRACGERVPRPRRFRVCALPTPMNARSSTRLMRALSSSWCRLWTL